MAMTLWEARGRTREVKSNCPPSMADGFINRRIRNVIDTRTWSDLMKIGMIVLPTATTTGTVNMTPASNQVAGIATAWPVADRINVVSTTAIVDSPGYVEITPTAGTMSLIQPGMLLLLDQENASVTEILTVQYSGPTSFTAYCQYAHDQNVTIQQSSLAGQQFSTNAYTYTVQAILTTTSLQIDMLYGGLAQAGVSYSIRQQYVTISPTARKLKKQAWDAIAGQTVGTSRDFNWLNIVDPQRQSTGNPLELCMMPPSPGGVMRWEVWPRQSTKYAIGVLYEDGFPTLYYDTDLFPSFINPEVIIAGACADALRTKVIPREGRVDPYFDLNASAYWESEYARLLEIATQSDQGRSLTYLTNYLEEVQSACWNWQRAHAVTASGVGWGAG